MGNSARKQEGWNLNYAGIASMWRGGCIIKVCSFPGGCDCFPIRYLQSVFLSDITAAYRKDPHLESLLFDDFFNKGEFLSLSQKPSVLYCRLKF
jgi:6-phosphogluconate dehydrogenase